MFLKLAYLPSKLCFLGKYLFKEHQISAGQPAADSSSTETLYCLNSNLELIIKLFNINTPNWMFSGWNTIKVHVKKWSTFRRFKLSYTEIGTMTLHSSRCHGCEMISIVELSIYQFYRRWYSMFSIQLVY